MSPALPFLLVGQTGAALCAATGQDLAAVGSSHSLAEAVDLLAVQLLGLIGTLSCHIETPPVRFPVLLPGHLLDTFFMEKGAVNLLRRIAAHVIV